MDRPIWEKPICGIYSAYPGIDAMPREFGPVWKPSEDRLAKLPTGLSLCSTLRKTVARASLTAVVPIVFVLLITNCCAREGVVVGKPGTLGLKQPPPTGIPLSRFELS